MSVATTAASESGLAYVVPPVAMPGDAAVRVAVVLEVVAQLRRHPVGADGHPAAEALPERDDVGLQAPRARQPP